MSSSPASTMPVEKLGWDVLEKAFFKGRALRRLIVHLCNSWAQRSADPISDTLRMILSTPVQLVLTDIGMSPFKGMMFHVMPYKKMTRRQLRLLSSVVSSVTLSAERTGASRQIGGN